MTLKRRRSTNISISCYNLLHKEAPVRSINPVRNSQTATTLASMILCGQEPALQVIQLDSRSKSLSMKESLWLSIKYRADYFEKSIRRTTNDILIGAQPPLTDQEIELGERWASSIELERSRGVPEKDIDKGALIPFKIFCPTDEASSNNIDRINRDYEFDPLSNGKPRTLSSGNPIGDDDCENTQAKELQSGEDFYGGVFTI